MLYWRRALPGACTHPLRCCLRNRVGHETARISWCNWRSSGMASGGTSPANGHPDHRLPERSISRRTTDVFGGTDLARSGLCIRSGLLLARFGHPPRSAVRSLPGEYRTSCEPPDLSKMTHSRHRQDFHHTYFNRYDASIAGGGHEAARVHRSSWSYRWMARPCGRAKHSPS